MSSRVAIERCKSYEPAELAAAVSAALAAVGPLEALVKPGARVFLKINHLGHHPPEAAVNTHPEFLRAVIELLKPITPHITVGDGLGSRGLDGFELSGTLAVCRDTGVKLVNFRGGGYRDVTRADYSRARSVPIAAAAMDADVVINLPKLKTHMLCLMTCAVKNSYGYLPHELKVNFHKQYAHPDDFAQLVVDVFAARPPELTLVDAVVAMEGSGPSRGGRPKALGLVLAGRDAVAVDAVASALMGLAPSDVATTRHAARRGLGEADLARIDITGASIADVKQTFALPATATMLDALNHRLPAGLRRMLAALVQSTLARPRIVASRCIGCALCAKHCPVHAIAMEGGKARIDDRACLMCFCCQEFCESNAVGVKRSGLGRVAGAAGAMRRALKRKRRA